MQHLRWQGEPATLELRADGTLVGSTGCRSLSGSYTVAGDEVVFTEFSADGECPSELQSQDDQVVTVLGDGFTVEIDGDRLTLTSSGSEGLVYRKSLTSGRRLEHHLDSLDPAVVADLEIGQLHGAELRFSTITGTDQAVSPLPVDGDRQHQFRWIGKRTIRLAQYAETDVYVRLHFDRGARNEQRGCRIRRSIAGGTSGCGRPIPRHSPPAPLGDPIVGVEHRVECEESKRVAKQIQRLAPNSIGVSTTSLDDGSPFSSSAASARYPLSRSLMTIRTEKRPSKYSSSLPYRRNATYSTSSERSSASSAIRTSDPQADRAIPNAMIPRGTWMRSIGTRPSTIRGPTDHIDVYPFEVGRQLVVGELELRVDAVRIPHHHGGFGDPRHDVGVTVEQVFGAGGGWIVVVDRIGVGVGTVEAGKGDGIAGLEVGLEFVEAEV